MAKTSAIFIFCLAILPNFVSSFTSMEPFLEGYNQACGRAYELGCEVGEQEPEGAYNFTTSEVDELLGIISGLTAGFSCGLCESGFFGCGNTTLGKGKEAQCKNHDDKKAECCKNDGLQCGDNEFRKGYNAAYVNECKAGYQFGRGNFEQGSLVVLGIYVAGIRCSSQGFQDCSLRSEAPGSVNGGNN